MHPEPGKCEPGKCEPTVDLREEAEETALIDCGFSGPLYQVVVDCQFLERTSPCNPTVIPHHR